MHNYKSGQQHTGGGGGDLNESCSSAFRTSYTSPCSMDSIGTSTEAPGSGDGVGAPTPAGGSSTSMTDATCV